MKIAIIGSRNLYIDNFGKFLPKNVSEIVSGGARGIDFCAARYAKEVGIKITVFTPEYEKYGRVAPLKRNLQIINHADEAIAFWNGKSNGTKHVIETCKKQGKKVTVYIL